MDIYVVRGFVNNQETILRVFSNMDSARLYYKAMELKKDFDRLRIETWEVFD